MADRPFTILSLCSGAGGLELGLELCLPAARVVCNVEREAYCVELLASRCQAEGVAPAPVWSDVRSFDGRRWRGCVDCITAGYPCQPFSVAGKRRGSDDSRHLWPDIARIVGEVAPPIVFFENVPGHIALGFREVAGELEGMGYKVEADVFSAREVGATHLRKRLFILGVADGAGERCEQDVADAERPRSRDGDAGKQGGPRIGRGGRDGRAPDAGRSAIERDAAAGPGEELRPCAFCGYEFDHGLLGKYGCPDCNGEGMAKPGRARSQGVGEAWSATRAVERGGGDGLPLFPPGPGELDAWRAVLELDPTLEPAIHGVADGLGNRVDRLRATGNGVCPLVAAYAFAALWSVCRS